MRLLRLSTQYKVRKSEKRLTITKRHLTTVLKIYTVYIHGTDIHNFSYTPVRFKSLQKMVFLSVESTGIRSTIIYLYILILVFTNCLVLKVKYINLA